MYFRRCGTLDVVVKVPDTITTWETDVFCLSSIGFGLAPRTDLKVFQPFFLELTLPYSVIRGEHFELKATVFNYLTKCIMVRLLEVPTMMRGVTFPVSKPPVSCSSALKITDLMPVRQMDRL